MKNKSYLPVSDSTTPMRLASLAELEGLSSEGPLIDPALGGARERHAVVVQLDDSVRCLPSHVVDGVLRQTFP